MWTKRRAEPSEPRLLLTWWGAFRGGGGATLGDYHAVVNVWRWLRERGVAADIMNDTPAPFDGIPTVGSDLRDDGIYSGLVFACGPLVMTRGLRRLLRRFRQVRKVAVGVSVIDGSPAAGQFDRVVARDSSGGVSFDLALAYADSVTYPRADLVGQTAVCLRGPQKTYGRENCLDATVDTFLQRYAAHLGTQYRVVDTILRPGNNVADVESGIASASVLITTRMHGALFSLAARTPFVAIDQIVGGAKVSRLMAVVKWPWSFRADQPDFEAWARAADALRTSGWTEEMELRRAQALLLSRNALELCGEAIISTLVGSPRR